MLAVPKLLIVASTGPTDPTRASIPFHIAANGAATAGVGCEIALAGDATELVKPEVAAGGIPPLADLLAKCAAQNITFYV